MTALDLLQHGEICVIVVDGIEHEAVWSAEKQIFQLRHQFGQMPPSLVDEWWPAGVKF